MWWASSVYLHAQEWKKPVGTVMTVSHQRQAALAAASERSAARQRASRCRTEKVSKEIKKRSTSEGARPEQAVGMGNRNQRLGDGGDSK